MRPKAEALGYLEAKTPIRQILPSGLRDGFRGTERLPITLGAVFLLMWSRDKQPKTQIPCGNDNKKSKKQVLPRSASLRMTEVWWHWREAGPSPSAQDDKSEVNLARAQGAVGRKVRAVWVSEQPGGSFDCAALRSG